MRMFPFSGFGSVLSPMISSSLMSILPSHRSLLTSSQCKLALRRWLFIQAVNVFFCCRCHMSSSFGVPDTWSSYAAMTPAGVVAGGGSLVRWRGATVTGTRFGACWSTQWAQRGIGGGEMLDKASCISGVAKGRGGGGATRVTWCSSSSATAPKRPRRPGRLTSRSNRSTHLPMTRLIAGGGCGSGCGGECRSGCDDVCPAE